MAIPNTLINDFSSVINFSFNKSYNFIGEKTTINYESILFLNNFLDKLFETINKLPKINFCITRIPIIHFKHVFRFDHRASKLGRIEYFLDII